MRKTWWNKKINQELVRTTTKKILAVMNKNMKKLVKKINKKNRKCI